ncbi:hypothetical protein Tco_0693246 [Tanacetum coccineum]
MRAFEVTFSLLRWHIVLESFSHAIDWDLAFDFTQELNISRANPQAAIASKEQLVPNMHSEEQDYPLSKLINTIEGEFKFGMKIPDTMTNDANKESVEYKYYKIKKDESEKGDVEEEPEEQHVSPAKRGRGKYYMCLGNQEVNVSSKPKKAVVPKKPRIITVADNIIEQEIVAVKLEKIVSIEEQRLQQREIMTQLTIEKQVKKDVNEGYAPKRGLKFKGAATEDSAIQSLLALRK